MKDRSLSGGRLPWDYTELADAYLQRPQYVDSVVDVVISSAGLNPHSSVADIGAGTGNLTTLFLERGYKVDAVEPNAAMRKHGVARTERFGSAVRWVEAVAECTTLPRGAYAMVTFGSSFNVVDAQVALRETAAVLCPRGWFMCCWNHRDLDDALQQAVEGVILKRLPHYEKGARVQDQTEVIACSRLFEPAQAISGKIVHRVKTSDWVTAWRSHATLVRQAGEGIEAIVADIEAMLGDRQFIDVPYVTNCWLAQRI